MVHRDEGNQDVGSYVYETQVLDEPSGDTGGCNSGSSRKSIEGTVAQGIIKSTEGNIPGSTVMPGNNFQAGSRECEVTTARRQTH